MNGKRIGDIEVVGLVVPSTYYGAFESLTDKIDELYPDIILGTGLSSSVKRIRFESVGENVMDGKYPDADGLDPKGKSILPGEKYLYWTNANNPKLARLLHDAGILSEVSVDAEKFICNSLIYLTARRIEEENLPIRHAFLHTPWTEDYLDRVQLELGKIAIPKDRLEKAIELTLLGMAQD